MKRCRIRRTHPQIELGIAHTLDAARCQVAASEYLAMAEKADADGIGQLASLWRARAKRKIILCAFEVAEATAAFARVVPR